MSKNHQTKNYRNPRRLLSFGGWLRQAMHVKLTLLPAFILIFGGAGYVTLAQSFAASAVTVNASTNDGGSSQGTFYIEVRQPDGNFLSYGTRTTPVTLGNDGEARLTFASATNGYSFNGWYLGGQYYSSQTIQYLPANYNGQTIILSLYKQPPPPPPAPAPAPTPAPAPAPSPAHAPTPAPTTAYRPPAVTPPSTTNPTQTAPPPANQSDGEDKTPPEPPKDFNASADERTGHIELFWAQATDNVGIKHYVLERSTDQQNWEKLDEAIEELSYRDTAVAFETKYFYRLTAVDTNNNVSSPATADATTPVFKANVTVSGGGSFGVEGDWLEVTVPANAVAEDALCSVVDLIELVSGEKGEELFAGPYRISCNTKAGTGLSSFLQPATVTMKLDKDVSGKYKEVSIYEGDDNGWKKINASRSGDTVTFNLQGRLHFAGFGQKESMPLILKILVGVLILAGLTLGVLYIMYLRYRKRQLAQYEDYRRKAMGF